MLAEQSLLGVQTHTYNIKNEIKQYFSRNILNNTLVICLDCCFAL